MGGLPPGTVVTRDRTPSGSGRVSDFFSLPFAASLHSLSQRRSLLAFLQLLPLAVSSVGKCSSTPPKMLSSWLGFLKQRENGCLTSPHAKFPPNLQILFFFFTRPLLPPALSTDPSYHFCYEGEHLTFLCMAKTMRKIGRFWFFNQTGEQIDLRSLYPLPTARLQLTATKVSAGECSYMYFMEDSGQEIPSKRSFPLTVEVQGRLVLSYDSAAIGADTTCLPGEHHLG